MQSFNHQYAEFQDQVKQRWVKVGIAALSGYRLNPRNAVNPNERIDFLLATPDDDVEVIPYNDGEPTKVKQTVLVYENEVLELYSDIEVRSFKRMNRLLIENGLLVQYDGAPSEINEANAIDNTELKKIANLKQTAVFKARVNEITSAAVIQRLLDILEDTEDVKYAHVKYVRGKLNELNGSKDS